MKIFELLKPKQEDDIKKSLKEIASRHCIPLGKLLVDHQMQSNRMLKAWQYVCDEMRSNPCNVVIFNSSFPFYEQFFSVNDVPEINNSVRRVIRFKHDSLYKHAYVLAGIAYLHGNGFVDVAIDNNKLYDTFIKMYR